MPGLNALLVDKCPKSGLVYFFKHHVTTPGMDRLIIRNLKAHGVTHQSIKFVLAEPFLTGITLIRVLNIQPDDGVDKFLETVQGCNEWTATLPFDVFKTLFSRLIEAQMSWNNNKRHPLDRSQHCELAKKITMFRKIGDIYPVNDDTDLDNATFFADRPDPTEAELKQKWGQMAKRGELWSAAVDAERKRKELRERAENMNMSDMADSLRDVDAGRLDLTSLKEALDALVEEDEDELQIFT